MRFLPVEEVAHQRLYLRDTRRAADQHHFLDVVWRKLGVFERQLHRLHGALEQVVHHLLQARPRQLQLHVQRSAGPRGDKRQVDLRLHHLRQLDLGFLGRFLQPLQRHAVLAQVNIVLFLELIDQPVHDALVHVVAAQVRVPVGGLHFDDAAAHLQHGNVERAAAQVVHRDRFIILLVQPVRQRRCGRLVDDSYHFHAGDFARLLGGLPLRIVEVRGHGDDRLAHLFTKEVFCRGLQLGQNHRGDFRRAVEFAGDFDPGIIMRALDDPIRHSPHLFADFVVPAAHEALDRIHRVFRIGHRLPLGHLSDQALTRLGDRHNRRRRPGALLVGDDHRLPALHDCDNRVGRPQVNSNDLAHNPLASSNRLPFAAPYGTVF